MIVASQRKSVSPKSYQINRGGKAAIFGPAYEGFKTVSKAYGFYKDIKPYLPENILGKYKYKTHKRVFGYASQKFHAKPRIPQSGFQSKACRLDKEHQIC